MPNKTYKYAVLRKFKGGQRTMLKTTSYKKASDYYFKHPRAFGIQRYTKHGVTAGLLQPRIPSKIRHRGKPYTRAYVGPHTKRTAKTLAKGLRKSKPLKGAIAKKFKKGWFVFVR